MAEVKVKITGDARPAEAEVGRLTRALNAAKAAAGRVVGTMNAARQAVGRLMSAMGVIGLAVQAVQWLAEGYRKLTEWMHRAERAAAELARRVDNARHESAVSKAAEEYRRLNSEIERTLGLERLRDALEEKRRGRGRDFEDAALELERQGRIAKLDPAAADYADRKAEIDDDISVRAARAAARRAAEDAEAEEARKRRELAERERQAAGIAASIEADREVVGRARVAIAATPHEDEERRRELRRRVEEANGRIEAKGADLQRARDAADALREELAAGGGGVAAAAARAAAAELAARTRAGERAAARERRQDDGPAPREDGGGARDDARAPREAGPAGVSQNRLTAMGLGSGVRGRDGVADDVRKIVGLLKEEVEATRANRPDGGGVAAVVGEG